MRKILICLLSVVILMANLTIAKSVVNYIHTRPINIIITSPIQSGPYLDEILSIIENAPTGQLIVLHMSGYGGDGLIMQHFFNAFRLTHGTVVAVVEGNVYSADSVIAASAQYLQMLPGTTLMFHTTSTHGFNCAAMTELDRGHNPVPKCKQFMKNADDTANFIIDHISILTEQEKKDIEDGYDVYLTAQEVWIRQTDMTKATVVPVVKDDLASDNKVGLSKEMMHKRPFVKTAL